MLGNQNALGNAGGRPTKYEPRFAKELLDFFRLTEAAYERVNDMNGKPYLVGKTIPTFQRFAWKIGVDALTLWRWANDKDEDGMPINSEFCSAYARAKSYQEALIIEGGLVGAFNPSFTNLLVRNLHDWKDKTEATLELNANFDSSAVNEELAKAEEERIKNREIALQRIQEYST